MPADPTVARADARFAEWMRDNLHLAADQFRLTLTGEPVYGWRLRSIGARATHPSGPRWLRVVSEFPQWATGDTWTGNTDANVLTGIPKPQVLEVVEWDEQHWRRQRAEMMTLLPDHPVSITEQLQAATALPDTWWVDLRVAVDILRAATTRRTHTTQTRVTDRTREAFGVDLPIQQWETVHGDLHWANLLAPTLGVLDWELWGRGPAGTDPATLLLHSLPVPAVAARVHTTFADLLDTDDGHRAQLAVAARLHLRIADGDYPDLVDPLRRHLQRLRADLA